MSVKRSVPYNGADSTTTPDPRAARPRAWARAVSMSHGHGSDPYAKNSTRIEAGLAGVKPGTLTGVKVNHTEGGGPQNLTAEVVFIPLGFKFNAEAFATIADKTWALFKPNLVIQCDAGSMHPSQQTTVSLIRLPGFEEWRRYAVQHQQASSGRADRDGKPELIQTERAILDELLFKRIISIYVDIVEAAAFAKNWIVVDRISGKSAAADLLLELALQRTSQRPVIIVMDTLQRLDTFDSDAANKQWSFIEQAVRKASTIGAVGEDRNVVNMPWQYCPDDFLDAELFYDKPNPKRGGGTLPPGKRWETHYLQNIFSYGTHHLLFQDPGDALSVEDLGRIGCVFSNGSDDLCARLRSRIESGTPLVMMYNTGGATQAFGSMQRMLQHGPSPSASIMLAKAEICSTDAWTETFGLPEIMGMKQLKARAPNIFRKTVVSVDLIHDTEDEILETITACFSAVDGGLPELGLGDAEAMVVRSAWKRHLTHYANAKQYRRRSVALNLIYNLLALVTTLFSVLYSVEKIAFAKADKSYTECMSNYNYVHSQEPDFDPNAPNGCEPPSKSTQEMFQYATVILPIVTVLVSTILSRFRPSEKWTACCVAAAEIVAEIYMYRTRGGDYDDANFIHESSTGKVGHAIHQPWRALESPQHTAPRPQVGLGTPASRARALFTTRVSELYSSALLSEVAKGGALALKGPAVIGLGSEEQCNVRATAVQPTPTHPCANA